VIEVHDQGEGIAPENIERIFERFERIPKDEVRVSGLGLGLFISQQIIERHGGKISVSSQVNQGSVFTVELPLA